jgi:adenosylcobinamide-phosphate synthase
MTEVLLIIFFAAVLDRLLPGRAGFRPFVWYRDWAESIEQRFNGGSRLHGISAVVLATVPVLLGIMLVLYILGKIGQPLRFIADVIVLYLCLDLYRLGNVAGSISDALEQDDVAQADEYLRDLSGKSAEDITETGVARATVVAVLKQGNTAVIAPLFWFILLGPFGTLLQRFVSILDNLWGHRDERYGEFGWAAARLDDLLGWVPARITAMSYAIMGSFEDALLCWRARVGMWSDINSGPLLASGFGAMHLQNCEDIDVDAEEEAMGARPMPLSVMPEAVHVRRAMALVWRVLLFWLSVVALMYGAHIFGIIIA